MKLTDRHISTMPGISGISLISQLHFYLHHPPPWCVLVYKSPSWTIKMWPYNPWWNLRIGIFLLCLAYLAYLSSLSYVSIYITFDHGVSCGTLPLCSNDACSVFLTMRFQQFNGWLFMRCSNFQFCVCVLNTC